VTIDRCGYKWLGQVEYEKALDLQAGLVCRIAEERLDHSLLFLEHPPTYTLGRGGNPSHLLVTEERLKELGAVLHRTDRGGDITFHGPGQLVGYPILDLKRLDMGVRTYVRGIEEVLIKALSAFSIKGERLPGFTGVWVDDKKVAAVGVRLNRNRITSHGFAINVNNDLTYFSNIIPCGIRDKEVTSLAGLTDRAVRLTDVLKQVVKAFGDIFGMIMERRYEQEIIS
jgi:lipoyl(octanoyl) transferase